MNFKHRLIMAFNVFKYGGKETYWNKPNGCCSQCGAPLNDYMVGGYKLHDGEFSVSFWVNATKQQLFEIKQKSIKYLMKFQ